MFEINIKTARKVLSEFQTQLKQLNQIIYETEEIVSNYLSEEQNTLMRNRVKTELDAMMVQRKRLLEYVSALRQVIELYEETEMQILEYEEIVIRKPRQEATWISIQYSEETSNFIKQIEA